MALVDESRSRMASSPPSASQAPIKGKKGCPNRVGDVQMEVGLEGLDEGSPEETEAGGAAEGGVEPGLELHVQVEAAGRGRQEDFVKVPPEGCKSVPSVLLLPRMGVGESS